MSYVRKFTNNTVYFIKFLHMYIFIKIFYFQSFLYYWLLNQCPSAYFSRKRGHPCPMVVFFHFMKRTSVFYIKLNAVSIRLTPGNCFHNLIPLIEEESIRCTPWVYHGYVEKYLQMIMRISRWFGIHFYCQINTFVFCFIWSVLQQLV